jgi:hypothetical protein
MRTSTKVILAFALTLVVGAPSLSHAAYFSDSTRVWPATQAQGSVKKKVPVHRATDAMAYAPADQGGEYVQDFGIGSQR